MAKDQKEWFRQADYDMDAVAAMYKSEKYIYAIFLCHLSIEKALKGHYFKNFGEQAPKTHNLLYLIEKNGIKFPEHLDKFIIKLNRESVVTRYPEDIRRMSKDYTRKTTDEIIAKSKEALEWLREKL
jgi:HEPN domain-containing protein